MSSSNSNKKLKPFSTASLGKITSEYATHAQTAEKASSSKPTRNPDLNTLPDQNIMSQINNVLSEDYRKIFPI